MIRYADPEVCPCCRLQIPFAAQQCPHCRAALTGAVAQGLFRTLAHADYLVAQLAATAPAPVLSGVAGSPAGPTAAAGHRVDPAYPSLPTPPPASARRR